MKIFSVVMVRKAYFHICVSFWQSSFLVKSVCGSDPVTTEKYNLTAQNSFKFQGIANGKAVDISQYYTDADKEKKNPKGITLCTKSPKGINAPVSH